MTATGPVGPDRLGRVLMHEHVLSLAPGSWLTAGTGDDRVALAVSALQGLRDAGVGTVVDLTTRRVPPSRADALHHVAERTGLHVVVGVGFYTSPHQPDWVASASIQELTGWYVGAAEDGIDGTRVRAGCFGELGTSLHRITPAEERNLRAAARAHRETGVPVSTHCTLGTMGREQVALLEEEGADLSRVVIGHQDLAVSAGPVLAVLEAGANVGFDTLGKEWFDYRVPASGRGATGPDFTAGAAPPLAHAPSWVCRRTDADRLDLLLELLDRGYADQIVLSMDLLGRELHANADSHGMHGYRYVTDVVVPELRRRGLDTATLDRLLTANPARILAIPFHDDTQGRASHG